MSARALNCSPGRREGPDAPNREAAKLESGSAGAGAVRARCGAWVILEQTASLLPAGMEGGGLADEVP